MTEGRARAPSIVHASVCPALQAATRISTARFSLSQNALVPAPAPQRRGTHLGPDSQSARVIRAWEASRIAPDALPLPAEPRLCDGGCFERFQAKTAENAALRQRIASLEARLRRAEEASVPALLCLWWNRTSCMCLACTLRRMSHLTQPSRCCARMFSTWIRCPRLPASNCRALMSTG